MAKLLTFSFSLLLTLSLYFTSPSQQKVDAASAAQNASWTLTGNLQVARLGHTATLLNNGTVLVTGGFTIPAPGITIIHNTAELYQPATGTWSFTGSLIGPRQGHTATLLPNGKVLVVGGTNGAGNLNTAELFDPNTNSWTSTTNLPSSVAGHTATLLTNGKVLVAGGQQNLARALLYDPSAQTWTHPALMNRGHMYHTATFLPNGKVLIAAGFDSFAAAELYDPTANTWTLAGTLSVARRNHRANLLTNGKVLITGGYHITNMNVFTLLNTTEIYDPATNSWTPATNMNAARESHTASLLPNGKVLVSGDSNTGVTQPEYYDPLTNSWTLTALMNSPRVSQTATLLPNGALLVAGGSYTTTNSAELFATTQTCSLLTITASPAPPFPAVTVGKASAISYTVSGNLVPVTWSVSNGALPNGLTLDALTGLLSGIPTTPGTFNFSVRATASNCFSELPYTLAVNKGTPVINLSATPNQVNNLSQFTADVRSIDNGGIRPTGTVQFKLNGGNLFSPVTLVNGRATLNVTINSIGSYNLTASYSGDSAYLAANAAAKEPFLSFQHSIKDDATGNYLLFNASNGANLPTGSFYVRTCSTLFSPGSSQHGVGIISVSGHNTILNFYIGSAKYPPAPNRQAKLNTSNSTGVVTNGATVNPVVHFTDSNTANNTTICP